MLNIPLLFTFLIMATTMEYTVKAFTHEINTSLNDKAIAFFNLRQFRKKPKQPRKKVAKGFTRAPARASPPPTPVSNRFGESDTLVVSDETSPEVSPLVAVRATSLKVRKVKTDPSLFESSALNEYWGWFPSIEELYREFSAPTSPPRPRTRLRFSAQGKEQEGVNGYIRNRKDKEKKNLVKKNQALNCRLINMKKELRKQVRNSGRREAFEAQGLLSFIGVDIDSFNTASKNVADITQVVNEYVNKIQEHINTIPSLANFDVVGMFTTVYNIYEMMQLPKLPISTFTTTIWQFCKSIGITFDMVKSVVTNTFAVLKQASLAKEAQGLISFASNSTVIKSLFTILTSMSWLIYHFKVPTVENISSNLAALGRASQGFRSIKDAWNWFFATLQDFYAREKYGISADEVELTRAFPELDKYLSLAKFINGLQLDIFDRSSVAVEQTQKLCLCLEDVRAEAMRVKNTQVRDLCAATLSSLREVRQRCLNSPAANLKTRRKPICFYFFGNSGVGKTLFLKNLILKSVTDLYPEYTMNNVVYTRKVGNEFWDGYFNQPIVQYDDFGQQKDSESKPNEEYFELINTANDAPFQLHMSSILDKKNTYFTSEVLLLSTNLEKPDVHSLVSEDAVFRRLDVLVEIKIKKEYGIKVVSAKTNRTYYRYDEKVAREHLKSLGREYESFSLDAYEFQLYRLDGKTRMNMAVLDYPSFIDFYINKIKEHRCESDELMLSMLRQNGVSISDVTNKDKEIEDTLGDMFKQEVDPKALLDEVSLFKNFLKSAKGEVSKIWTAQGKDSFSDASEDIRIELVDDDYLAGVVAPKKPVSSLSLVNAYYSKCTSYVSSKLSSLKESIQANAIEFKQSPRSYLKELLFEIANCAMEITGHVSLFVDSHFSQFRNICKVALGALAGYLFYKWAKNSHTNTCQFLGNLWFPHSSIEEACGSCDSCNHFGYIEGDFAFNLRRYYLNAIEMIRNNDLDEEGLDHFRSVVSRYTTEMNRALDLSVYGFQAESKETQTRKGKGRLMAESKEIATRKGKPRLSAEGDATPVSIHRNGRLVAQGGDCVRLEQVSSVMIKNGCRVAIEHEDGRSMTMSGYFVTGRIMQLPNHFFAQVRTGREIFRLYTGYDMYTPCLTCTVNDLKRFHCTDATGELTDACLVALPLVVASRPDIVNKFISAKDWSLLSESTELVRSTYVDHGPTVIMREDSTANFRTHEAECYDWNQEWIRVNRCIEYDMESKVGYCGGIVSTRNSLISGKLLGFHVAGNKSSGLALATSQEFLRRNLGAMARKFRLDSKHLVDGRYPYSAEGLQGDYVSMGKLTPVNVPSKTELQKSLIHNKTHQSGNKPARLLPFMLGGALIDPLLKGMQKCLNVQKLNSDSDLDIVCNDVAHLYENDDERRVYSFEEGVQGIEGDDFFKPVNRTTSPGYPYCLNNPGKGKQHWLGKDDSYNLNTEAARKLRKDVEDLLENCRQGKRGDVVSIATLKDEKRPIAKVDAGKTRVFQATPQHFVIAFRMYFMSFIRSMMKNKITNESAVGTNPYSIDWHKIGTYLTSKGDKVIAGDFSNFDGSLTQQILWRVLDIINGWYDDDEENQRIRTVLWEDIVSSNTLVKDEAIRLTHSQPSGNPATVIINTVFNCIVMRLAYLECKRMAGIDEPYFDFTDNVSLMVYGDDNVLNISDRVIEWYNQNAITHALAKFGLTYTDEGKTGVLVDYRTINDVNFLKRSFHRDENGYFRALLEKDVVMDIPNWVRGKEVRSATRGNIEASLLDSAMHGSDFYLNHVKDLKRACRDAGISFHAPSFKEHQAFLAY